MTTVTSNKFKSTTIYGTLSVIDNPTGNIISNTTLSGNLTVGGKINNIPVATIEYVSNLTSDAQTQIDTKAPLASPTFTGTVSGITKSMVGLSNVDNTTDLSKPISTATQTALNLKAPLESPSFTGTVSGITKTMVGLSNVDNTTDLSKPISTATQTALNLKAPLESPTFTGTVSGITKTMVGLSNADNTTDLSKPISTSTQTALNLKAPLESPTFTGSVNGITKAMVGLSNADNTTDLNKPISTATQTALNLLGGLSSDNAWSGINTFNTIIPTTILTPTLSSQFITKAYADSNYAGTGILSGTNSWLGTNTYNTNLPTSTLTPTTTSHLTNKAYVDLKAPLASPTFTGTVSGITKSMVGLGDVDNTTDLLKPLSTATTNALILKAPLASPTFTGTLTVPNTIISSIDMYGNYTGMKPINGNYLQFYTLAGFTFNCNTATGFTGSNEALRIDNSAITLNKPTTINGTLTTTELTASGLITADNGLTISNGGINCININNSTDIYSNQYLRNLNHSNSGFCELFSNATTNDNIMIGSNVSTTRLTGQSVNIETDLYTTGLVTASGGITFNNGTATNNKLSNVYQMVFDSNFPNEKIILYNSGSSLYNYSIGVLSDTLFYSSPTYHKFYIGGTGTTPVVTMTSSGSTFTGTTTLQATTVNATLTANSVAISTTNGLTTPIINLSDFNGASAYTGHIFQQVNNMVIRSWNSGVSPSATNMYFVTFDASSNSSHTMILNNNAIQLKQPTTITGTTTSSGLITGNNGLTISTGNTSVTTLTVSSNITLSNSISSWTFPSMLGSKNSIGLSTSKYLTVNGTQYNIIQYTIPQAGVYLIQAQACCVFGVNAGSSYFNFSISTTSATIETFFQTSVMLPPMLGHQQFSQLSKTIQVTNTTTIYYMVCSSSNNSTIPYLNNNLTYMDFTRIA